MTAPQHHTHQYKFAQSGPRATESIQIVWDPGAQTDSTECGDDLKQNIVQAEAWGRCCEIGALYDADEEEGEADPPAVGGELLL